MVTENEKVVKGLSDILRGAVIVFLGNILGMGATFGSRILLGRYLGPAKYGLIVLGITFLNIISLVVLLGFPEGIAREFPRVGHVERGDYLVTSLKYALPMAGTASIVLYAGRGLIETVLKEPGLGPVIGVFAMAILFFVIMKIVVAAFRGLQLTKKRTVVFNLLYQVGIVVFAALGILLGVNTVYIATAWLLALGLATIVGGYWLLREPKIRISIGCTRDRIDVRSFISLSLPLMVSNSVWILLQYTDSFLLGLFQTAGQVGIYDAAFTVSRGILLFVWAVAFLFLPVYSELHSESRTYAMQRIYQTSTKLLGFTVLPIVLVLASNAGTVLSLSFGKGFRPGNIALIVLLLGFVSHALLGINRGALTSIGLTKLVLWGNIVAFILNLGLNLILIPRYGITGAAIASAAAYVCANILWSATLFRMEAIHPFDISYIVTLMASLAGFALLLGIPSMYINLSAVEYFGLTTGYVGVHLALVVILGNVNEYLSELLAYQRT